MVGLLAVIVSGLASRAWPQMLPACLGKYPGDALWALMVFIGWAIVMPAASVWRIAAWAGVTSFAVEFSQLYQAGWIDAIRATTVGHLVLGSTFAWRDLVAYVSGIGAGVMMDAGLAHRGFAHLRTGLVVLAALVMLGVCLMLAAGDFLSKAVHADVGPPPADLKARPIELMTASHQAVAGWVSPGQAGQGVILLLHGVRADRRIMLPRARFLHALGYSTVLIDLPGHGQSDGVRISFGYHEAQAVKAALAYIAQTFPDDKVGVIGVSMGAASLVLSRPSPSPDAVVLESMYPTIREAVVDRLRWCLGSGGEALAPLLLWQLPWRLNVRADQLRPIVDLPALHAPLLLASGSVDRHTTLAETRRLYAAAAEPKSLWIVDGAAHVDLYDFDGPAYEDRIASFFGSHLRGQVNARRSVPPAESMPVQVAATGSTHRAPGVR